MVSDTNIHFVFTLWDTKLLVRPIRYKGVNSSPNRAAKGAYRAMHGHENDKHVQFRRTGKALIPLPSEHV